MWRVIVQFAGEASHMCPKAGARTLQQYDGLQGNIKPLRIWRMQGVK